MFEDLFQTSLQIHNQLIEDDRLNYFHSIMKAWGEMRYRHSKTLTAQPKRNGERFWQFSVGSTSSLSPWLQQNTKTTKSSSTHQTKSYWTFWRTRKTSETRIQNCSSWHHRTIHICQNATTPEKNNKSGLFGDLRIWADCNTPGKGIRTKWVGGSWRATSKHSEPKCPNTLADRPKPTYQHCKKSGNYRNQRQLH